MTTLIHLLGADIPHHNLTLLRFFNDQLSVQVPVSKARKFMVVAADATPFAEFSALDIDIFPDKKSLAQAVTRQAKDRRQQFFCHGQFNPWLWLALLSGKLSRHQLYWHIWGADLYEESRRLSVRLFYLMRRQAQKRVAAVWATRGDISHFRQRIPRTPASLLYFPARMPGAEPQHLPKASSQPLTILLGNSGDPANRHQQALADIHRQFPHDVQIIIPMGYPDNNRDYISQVQQTAAHYFPQGQVTLLTEKLDFTAYQALLNQCHLGYFIFERQQGIGTLCLLIEKEIPFVISRNNPFWQDLAEQQLPVLFREDELTLPIIEEARRQLSQCDKNAIAFMSPGYLDGWCRLLNTVEKGDL